MKNSWCDKKVCKNCCGTLQVFGISLVDSIYTRICLRHFAVRNVAVSWNLTNYFSRCHLHLSNNSNPLPLAGRDVPIALSNPPLPAGLALSVPKLCCTGVGMGSSEMPHDSKQDRCKPQTLSCVPGENRSLGLSLRPFSLSQKRIFLPPRVEIRMVSRNKQTDKHKLTNKPTFKIKLTFLV